ncbi:hypothetical protein [Gordonia sp. FQ]|uniref:hypothetical protein n=1 Tax=Gordonia sp. FQ TaxID=3446634 RepID=UPI003F85A315
MQTARACLFEGDDAILPCQETPHLGQVDSGRRRVFSGVGNGHGSWTRQTPDRFHDAPTITATRTPRTQQVRAVDPDRQRMRALGAPIRGTT